MCSHGRGRQLSSGITLPDPDGFFWVKGTRSHAWLLRAQALCALRELPGLGRRLTGDCRWWEKVISTGSDSLVACVWPTLRPTMRLFNTLLPLSWRSLGPWEAVAGG